MINHPYKNHPLELKVLERFNITVESEQLDYMYYRIVFNDPDKVIFSQTKRLSTRKYTKQQLQFEIYKAKSWVSDKIFQEIFV